MKKYVELNNWITIPGDISLKTAERRGNGNISEYQSDEVHIATRHCINKRVAIDVGAHIGIISYQLSNIFENVESFEINTELYNCLRKNISNHCKGNVRLHCTGLGNKIDQVDLSTPAKTLGTHIIPNKLGEYKIRPLDDYNFQNVDFIKIDVEGFETNVIRGAMKTIERCRPVILYERKGHGKRYGFDNDDPLIELRHLNYVKYQDIGANRKNAVIGPKKVR